MPLARALLIVTMLLGCLHPRAAGVEGNGSAPGGFGIRPDYSLSSPNPYRIAPRRMAGNEFSFPLAPRESLVIFEVDTLDGTLVYQAMGRDGRRLGTTIVSQEQDLLARTASTNAQSLGKTMADGALKPKGMGKDHIEIDIPFKVKSKTFRRIFGSGRIGLNVHGNISLKGTYRAEKRESESASAYNNNQNDFRLEQQQQFTVVGKIGEKVDVHIDQNTERNFDFENNLSIIYTGEPEEIIESISAGNISLSLPSTKYVSFSDQSSGLFGLKMVNRLGPLRLTGIASTEKNESKQQTFTGAASEKEAEYGPGEHVTGFFFINEYYRHQYRVYDQQSWLPITDQDLRIQRLDLYEFEPVSTEGTELTLVDPAGNVLNDGARYRMRKTSWDPAAENQPFSLDPDRGILRLNRIQEGRFIAIGYEVTGAGRSKLTSWFNQYGQYGQTITTGSMNATPGQQVMVVFPDHFNPETQPYWDLQLRNVFRLGTPDMDPTQFDLEIGRVVSGGQNQTSQNGTNYLSVLYLDVNDVTRNGPGNDQRVDERWVEKKTGNIWFPSPLPFSDRPEGLVLHPGAADPPLSTLYGDLYANYHLAPNTRQGPSGPLDRVERFADAEMDTLYVLRGQYFRQNPDTRWLELNQRYRMKSTAQVGTEVISLGWNVTNVTVTANNKRLILNTDYTLDEQAGLIRIINPTYTTKDQKIQVSYETPQLFQLRKKTFAGLTAELDLWETGREKSKLGAAWIYFNEQTAERKVRLGSEPIKNVVLDLNARLNFQPRMMTEWMDALPFIEADQPSSLNFEAEYAMVIPDPNPSNNPTTGDDKGVAYVDDFESSKQEIPLSIGHTQWFMAARPEHELLGLRGWMGWYNPRAKVPSREIWPEYQESNREGVSNEVRVLRLEYEPFRLASQDQSGADTSLTGEPLSRDRSWGGLYYDFRNAYDDLSDKKFIELTLLVEGDRSGSLNLDLGVVSEDAVPNNVLDTEDTDDDRLLQTIEDTGIDGMTGPDPPWPMPDELFAWSGTRQQLFDQFGAAYGFTDPDHTFDWWDLDGDGIRDPHEPWSYDDWIRAESDPGAVDKSHGGEGNSRDTDQIYPDTEDRNGNLTLDTANDYFSYRIPLNPADPAYGDYVSENSGTHWIFVRIPLNDDRRSTQGNPQLTLVNGIRLWMTGFNNPVRVTLAELNIVGNEWRKSVVADSDTSGYDVSVLNNYDNSDFYDSPPGVAGQKDLVTGVEAREQSLVLDLQGLSFGATAWARKQLATTINLAEYRELKMFVHGGTLDTTSFQHDYGNGQLDYHLRLLSTENDYYEYTKPIKAGWNPANNLHILFNEITGIDQFLGARRGREEPDKPVLLSDGGQMRVVGNPSITRVRSMLLGVTNHGSQPAQTEVWFNEMRVSNVKKEISRAMRAEMTARFSDVLTLSTNFEQKDADYHTVKERAAREGSAFKRNYSGGLDTNLGRLMPPSLGLTATFSVNVNNSLQVPKYYPNDDQEVNLDDHPEWVETLSRSRSASLSLRKVTTEGWWAQQILDKTSLSTDVSQTISRNVSTAADTSFTQNVRLGYSNQFRWTHTLKPLVFTENWPLVKKASTLEIGYFPQSLSLNASTARRISHTWKRDISQSHIETYTLSRNWSSSFKPLKTLTVNLQRSYDNNLKFNRLQARSPLPLSTDNANYLIAEDFRTHLGTWRNQATDLHDGDHTVRQTVGFTWGPKLTSWMTTNFSYNTTYNWTRDLVEPARGVNLGNSGTFTTDLKLEPDKLLRKLIWMSDARINAFKKEVDDQRSARLKKRQAETKERERAREEKRKAREAAKLMEEPGQAGDSLALAADSLFLAEAMADSLAATAEPVMEPGTLRRTQESPVEPQQDTSLSPPPGPVTEPLSPAEGLAEGLAEGEGGDSLRTEVLSLQPLLSDSLLQSLPDSMRMHLALADSLIKAGAAKPPAHDSLGTPVRAMPDSTSTREPSRILQATGRFFTGIWKRMGLAATKIEPIDIRFGRNENRTDPGMAIYPWTPVSRRHAGLAYQLALNRDPGVDTLRVSNLVFSNTRSFGYDYNLGTRVNLHKELPVRMGYDYSFAQQFSNESENSRRKSMTGWYSFENDPAFSKGELDKGQVVSPRNPTLQAVPNYSFSLRKLNRFPFLAKPFKDLTLNHDYKGKLDVAYAPSAEGMYRSQLTTSRDFNPLVGLDFQLEKGWGGNLSYKVGRSLRVNDPDGGNRSISFSRNLGWTISGQKVLRDGFSLPGFRKRFKNDTTVRLTYDNSRQLTLNSTADPQTEGGLIWNTPQNKRTWSLTLNSDYKFSRNVTGGASWKYGVDHSGTANDRRSYMEFQLNCRIEVRSR